MLTPRDTMHSSFYHARDSEWIWFSQVVVFNDHWPLFYASKQFTLKQVRNDQTTLQTCFGFVKYVNEPQTVLYTLFFAAYKNTPNVLNPHSGILFSGWLQHVCCLWFFASRTLAFCFRFPHSVLASMPLSTIMLGCVFVSVAAFPFRTSMGPNQQDSESQFNHSEGVVVVRSEALIQWFWVLPALSVSLDFTSPACLCVYSCMSPFWSPCLVRHVPVHRLFFAAIPD